MKPGALGHLVIRASAGSGKTFRLSGRYLALLAAGAEPGSILATTFTRKAAGEILGRVLGWLSTAAMDDERAAAMGRDALGRAWSRADAQRLLEIVARSMHRLNVCTLDSFFTRAASSYRLELGLPGSPRLLEASGSEAGRLRARAIESILAAGTEDDPQTLVTLLRQAFGDAHKRSIAGTLDELLRELHTVFRETAASAGPSEPTPWHQVTPLDALNTEDLTTLLSAMAELGPSVEPYASWSKAWQIDLGRALAGDWDGLLGAGIAKAIAQGNDCYRTKKPLPDDVLTVYRALVAHARAKQVNRVIEQTTATYDLLARYDAAYRDLRRQEGVVLFEELPWLLADRVVDSASLDEVFERLDTTVDHLLLDEFQDTAPVQWRVLRPIAEEICLQERGLGAEGWGLETGADDSSHPTPSPQSTPPILDRSFFCVGDVKQAIYGWRGGVAELLANVASSLHLGDENIESLNKSYRSSQVILDAVNDVFTDLQLCSVLENVGEGVGGATQTWAGRFETHTAAHEDQPGFVELLAAPVEEVSATATRLLDDLEDDESDADNATRGDQVSAQQWKAATLDAAARRTAELVEQYPGATIGVLTRTNKSASSLVRRLRSLGVAASGEGGGQLDDDPAVELVLSALTFADHPKHTAAAYHVINSPLGPELQLVSMHDDDLVAASRRLRRRLFDRGLARVIAELAEALLPVCGPRSAGRLTQLVERAEQHEATGVVSLRADEFVDLVRSERVEDVAHAPVRVMTVYKAKGLQFDAVVLAELWGRMGDAPRGGVWCYRKSPTDPPSAVIRSMNSATRETLSEHADWIGAAYRQEREARMADDLSAFYVAMTRPKHALIAVLPPSIVTKSGKRSITNWQDPSPAAVLRECLTDHSNPDAVGVIWQQSLGTWKTTTPPEAAPERSEGADNTTSSPVPHPPTPAPRSRRHLDVVAPSRLAEPTTIDPATWFTPTTAAIESALATAGDTLSDASSPDAGRLFGTVVHAMLETVGFLDDPDGIPTDAQLLAAGQAACGLAQLPENFDLYQPLAVVRRLLQSDTAQQILSRHAATDLWRERRFASRIDGRIVNGIIDRVSLWPLDRSARPDAKGPVARIIDFKTDAADDFDALLEHYRPQLLAYRTVVSRALRVPPERIEAGLLTVSSARWLALAD